MNIKKNFTVLKHKETGQKYYLGKKKNKYVRVRQNYVRKIEAHEILTKKGKVFGILKDKDIPKTFKIKVAKVPSQKVVDCRCSFKIDLTDMVTCAVQ